MGRQDRTVKILTIRLRAQDDQNLDEILATGCFEDDSEAVRFLLRLGKVALKRLIEIDPNAVLLEKKNQIGEVTFIENWSDDQVKREVVDILLEDMGPKALHTMLEKAKKRRELAAKLEGYVEMAKEMLQKHKPGPYSYEEIVDAVTKASWDKGNTIGHDLAMDLVRKEREAQRIIPTGPAKYDFVEAAIQTTKEPTL